MRIICTMVLAASFYTPALFAVETEGAPAAPQACQNTITVFQDVSAVGRKDKAAKNVTERHAEMALKGWRFVDMEVYTENGDLEGFYLSYVRDAACQKQSGG